ncbi:MAG TPA: hypothetical protein VFR81_04215 [Longimicrobium sp.]|nr:hypothetical protein [Longimicrobium sp.]
MSEIETEPAGVIRVRRERQFFGFVMRAYVHLDGVVVGRLRPGQMLTVAAAPGAHTLHVRGVGLGAIIASDTRPIHLRPGERADFHLVVFTDMLRSSFQLHRLSPPRLP